MNDNITEINKDTFWALIQEAKDTCGQDTDAWAKYMIDRLAGLGPDQSLMFLNYMDAYKDLSFRYGLWDAAKIFRVDGCSDDSFSYFRSWLIVQGKDVYMAALADPDSLADVEPYADCFFETAGYRQASDGQLRIDLAVINVEHRIGDAADRGCLSRQGGCSMGMFWDISAIGVRHRFPTEVRGCHVFDIVPNSQRHLVCHQLLF